MHIVKLVSYQICCLMGSLGGRINGIKFWRQPSNFNVKRQIWLEMSPFWTVFSFFIALYLEENIIEIILFGLEMAISRLFWRSSSKVEVCIWFERHKSVPPLLVEKIIRIVGFGLQAIQKIILASYVKIWCLAYSINL